MKRARKDMNALKNAGTGRPEKVIVEIRFLIRGGAEWKLAEGGGGLDLGIRGSLSTRNRGGPDYWIETETKLRGGGSGRHAHPKGEREEAEWGVRDRTLSRHLLKDQYALGEVKSQTLGT